MAVVMFLALFLASVGPAVAVAAANGGTASAGGAPHTLLLQSGRSTPSPTSRPGGLEEIVVLTYVGCKAS
jgi:hypothetical protein